MSGILQIADNRREKREISSKSLILTVISRVLGIGVEAVALMILVCFAIVFDEKSPFDGPGCL